MKILDYKNYKKIKEFNKPEYNFLIEVENLIKNTKIKIQDYSENNIIFKIESGKYNLNELSHHLKIISNIKNDFLSDYKDYLVLSENNLKIVFEK
jgi:hypothetical protein